MGLLKILLTSRVEGSLGLVFRSSNTVIGLALPIIISEGLKSSPYSYFFGPSTRRDLFSEFLEARIVDFSAAVSLMFALVTESSKAC